MIFVNLISTAPDPNEAVIGMALHKLGVASLFRNAIERGGVIAGDERDSCFFVDSHERWHRPISLLPGFRDTEDWHDAAPITSSRSGLRTKRLSHTKSVSWLGSFPAPCALLGATSITTDVRIHQEWAARRQVSSLEERQALQPRGRSAKLITLGSKCTTSPSPTIRASLSSFVVPHKNCQVPSTS